MTAEDEKYYAYFAGMFEGEGSVRARIKQSYYIKKSGERSVNTSVGIELKITSTDLFPLELCNDIFGSRGSITSTDPNFDISKQKRTDKEYKIRYDLIFCNFKMVEEIYSCIEFWLSPRRKSQCESALKLFKDNAKRGR
jgi:hypothetical protein